MKTLPVTILAAAAVLAGCSNDRRPRVEGIKVADDTMETLLTDLPARQVADCIASALHTSVQPDGSAYLVTATGTQSITYLVHPIDDKLKRFTTQVEQRGMVPGGDFIAATCLLQQSAPRS